MDEFAEEIKVFEKEMLSWRNGLINVGGQKRKENLEYDGIKGNYNV